jgi:hypothetical protein
MTSFVPFHFAFVNIGCHIYCTIYKYIENIIILVDRHGGSDRRKSRESREQKYVACAALSFIYLHIRFPYVLERRINRMYDINSTPKKLSLPRCTKLKKKEQAKQKEFDFR